MPPTSASARSAHWLWPPLLLLGSVTALIAWAAAAFQRWTGVRIDQAHREALHGAAMTGVNMALSKLGVAASGLAIDVKSAVIAQAIAWMEKSVPGALAHFRMTPDKLADLVESKIGLLAVAGQSGI